MARARLAMFLRLCPKIMRRIAPRTVLNLPIKSPRDVTDLLADDTVFIVQPRLNPPATSQLTSSEMTLENV